MKAHVYDAEELALLDAHPKAKAFLQRWPERHPDLITVRNAGTSFAYTDLQGCKVMRKHVDYIDGKGNKFDGGYSLEVAQ